MSGDLVILGLIGLAVVAAVGALMYFSIFNPFTALLVIGVGVTLAGEAVYFG